MHFLNFYRRIQYKSNFQLIKGTCDMEEKLIKKRVTDIQDVTIILLFSKPPALPV